MNNNLNIKVRKFDSNGYIIEDIIELQPKTSITPWGTEDFIWHGNYLGEEILVKLTRGRFEEGAFISKPDNLNISDQILIELKRVLRKLN
jgi:hypothetical protein